MRTLIFCGHLSDIALLSHFIPGALVLTGGMSTDERIAAISEFTLQEKGVMLATTVMATGWRAPRNTTVRFFGNDKIQNWPESLFIQAMGRTWHPEDMFGDAT